MASTIQVDKVQDTGGNTILSSNSTGTFTNNLPANLTGATGTLAIAQGGTGAATFAAAGLANTPAFFAFSNADQAVSDNTTTKVAANTEIFDSGDYDATTNYRFTPTVAGKYFVYGAVFIENATTTLKQATGYIYKNGGNVAGNQNNFQNSYGYQFTATINTVLDMNGSSDYAELFGYFDSSDGSAGTIEGHSSLARTYFGAYLMIGA